MTDSAQHEIDSKLKSFGKWTSLPRWIVTAWGDDQAIGIEGEIRSDLEEAITRKRQSTVKCVILYWPYCLLFLPLLFVRTKAAYYLERVKKKE